MPAVSDEAARLLDATGEAVIVTSLDGVIVFWSRAAERLYGWSTAETLGRNIVDVTPSNVSREQAQQLMDALAAGDTFSGDFAVRHKDGSTFLVNVHDAPWRDDDGKLIGVIGISRALANEDEATRHLRLLAEASRVHAETTDYATTLRNAANALVPALADVCVVHVGDARRALRRVAEATNDVHAEARIRALRDDEVAPHVREKIAEVQGTGRVALIEDVTRWALDGGPSGARYQQMIGSLAPRVALLVPLRIGDRPIGAMVLAMTTNRRFTEGDIRIAAQVGNRLALAVDTARLRAEADASARRYRSIVAATSQVMWRTDAAGRVKEEMPLWGTFTGQSTEQMLGHGWLDAIHPDERPNIERAWKTALESRTAFEVEYRLRRRDGGHTWVRDRGVPVLDADGNVLEWVGALEDITDKRTREKTLADERAIYETLYRIGRSLSTELDEEKLLQLVTDEATSLTGAEFGAFFFNTTNERGESFLLYTLSGAPREAFSKFPLPRATPIFAPTFKGEGIVRSDDIRKDPRYGKMGPQPKGHLPVVSYLAVPVITRAGEVLGGLFFGHGQPARFDELHERIATGIAGQAAIALENARLYARTRASEARARDADMRKDEFLAMLGHELRNPLAPIVTALEVLRMRNASGREHEVIDRQVRHLTRLVDDLLDVSRIARGKFQLKRTVAPLEPIVGRAIEMVAPLMEQRKHRLMTFLSAASISVDGDATRLTQVFTNLLTNAVKYTPVGGEVRVSSNVDERGVHVVIEDDGVGIDPELLPRIFEPFVQSARPIDRAEGGLGIGLAIVKSVVELHGGTVEVHSDGRDKGTRITVTLPVRAISEDSSRDLDRPSALMRARKAGLRVLVVDDNDDAADLLAEALRHVGHDVAIAHDGPAALRTVESFHPDVAVLDVGLPVMDGYELVQRLRTVLDDHVRFIAVTGYGQATDRARSKAAGFDVHLVKPIDIPELQRAIDPLPAHE
jgi:PAS domain S-box-containing protein